MTTPPIPTESNPPPEQPFRAGEPTLDLLSTPSRHHHSEVDGVRSFRVTRVRLMLYALRLFIDGERLPISDEAFLTKKGAVRSGRRWTNRKDQKWQPLVVHLEAEK